jgi:hypothetical protein
MCNSLKTERVFHRRYQTRGEVQADLFDYIEVFLQPEAPPLRVGLQYPERIPLGLVSSTKADSMSATFVPVKPGQPHATLSKTFAF